MYRIRPRRAPRLGMYNIRKLPIQITNPFITYDFEPKKPPESKHTYEPFNISERDFMSKMEINKLIGMEKKTSNDVAKFLMSQMDELNKYKSQLKLLEEKNPSLHKNLIERMTDLIRDTVSVSVLDDPNGFKEFQKIAMGVGGLVGYVGLKKIVDSLKMMERENVAAFARGLDYYDFDNLAPHQLEDIAFNVRNWERHNERLRLLNAPQDIHQRIRDNRYNIFKYFLISREARAGTYFGTRVFGTQNTLRRTQLNREYGVEYIDNLDFKYKFPFLLMGGAGVVDFVKILVDLDDAITSLATGVNDFTIFEDLHNTIKLMEERLNKFVEGNKKNIEMVGKEIEKIKEKYGDEALTAEKAHYIQHHFGIGNNPFENEAIISKYEETEKKTVDNKEGVLKYMNKFSNLYTPEKQDITDLQEQSLKKIKSMKMHELPDENKTALLEMKNKASSIIDSFKKTPEYNKYIEEQNKIDKIEKYVDIIKE